jgi:hypothetical protein
VVTYLRTLVTAQEAYRAENDEYADSFGNLEPYLSSALLSPPGGNGWPSASVAFALTVVAPLPGKGKKGKGQGGTPPGQGGTPPPATPNPAPPATDSIVYAMYIIQLSLPDSDHWQCTAEPLRDRTRNKFFYIDNGGVTRHALGTLADATSPPI